MQHREQSCKPNAEKWPVCTMRYRSHGVTRVTGVTYIARPHPAPTSRRRADGGRATGQSVTFSSISVTSAAIGERSLRVRVTWAKSGWPLSFSTTATTPS
jgi:hypothetical protein